MHAHAWLRVHLKNLKMKGVHAVGSLFRSVDNFHSTLTHNQENPNMKVRSNAFAITVFQTDSTLYGCRVLSMNDNKLEKKRGMQARTHKQTHLDLVLVRG